MIICLRYILKILPGNRLKIIAFRPESILWLFLVTIRLYSETTRIKRSRNPVLPPRAIFLSNSIAEPISAITVRGDGSIFSALVYPVSWWPKRGKKGEGGSSTTPSPTVGQLRNNLKYIVKTSTLCEAKCLNACKKWCDGLLYSW